MEFSVWWKSAHIIPYLTIHRPKDIGTLYIMILGSLTKVLEVLAHAGIEIWNELRD